MLATEAPFPLYTDQDGAPLDGGYIYFGAVNQDPVAIPVPIFWDSAGLIPAAQPIRTLNGYTVRNGTPALIYTDDDYSLTVKDRRNVTIYYAASSAVFGNAFVLGQLANDLADPTKGAGLIGFDATQTYATGLGAFLRAAHGRTAAELAAGVVPSNYTYPPGHVLRYGVNTTPGTTDMTAALQATINQAKQSGGAEAFWPAGTYRVGSLTLDGSGYKIRTAGGRKTILRQQSGTPQQTGQILRVTGSGIEIGDLAFVGNIATDTAEFHHCVYLFDDAAMATIRDIKIGDLYGTDIRGDVLYVSGFVARPTTGVRFGTISGTNVYRNLLSVVGGEVSGDCVIHDGPVGYRDLDVEPNSGGYQPGSLRLRYARIGQMQTACDDPTLMNGRVEVTELDCDHTRVANTTPAYPSHAGAGAAAVLTTYVSSLHIGYFKCRNYPGIPFLSSTAAQKSYVSIDVADIANCNTSESVYRSLFADQGTGGIAFLEIGTLLATLADTTRRVFNGNGMGVRVRRGTVTGGMLAANIPGGVFENMSVNVSGSTGIAMEGVSNCQMSNVGFDNATAATLFVNAMENTLVNVSGVFATIEGAGCVDNRAIRCNINGSRYVSDLLGGEVLTKPMADSDKFLTSFESTAAMIRTTGALTGDRSLVVSPVPRIYSVWNDCTGASVSFVAPTGTGVLVSAGARALVQFDGTNVVLVAS